MKLDDEERKKDGDTDEYLDAINGDLKLSLHTNSNDPEEFSDTSSEDSNG